ncbi:hypothetical protein D9757_005611 [Collybiopsis confluens]|uniref:Delta 8-(E)-sphingolipid desaturase n=1 Tax=Collybiopsis confluens TaxID=2823264 RepID=A0A8H5MBV5_9AGAR|nr:hypothetical protein D9757_005611 [Collybiopsis confluens]
MLLISQVDAKTISEIRLCLADASDRGLVMASKWLSELLLAIPASKRSTIKINDPHSSMLLPEHFDEPPKWQINLDVEAEDHDADVINVARKCMEVRQYHRAGHFLRNCASAKARFIAVYCQFITSEKKALHEWHKTDNTRYQPPLPVNITIHDLLESVQQSNDPWLQFLEALFLQRLSRIPEALDILYRSISACPWNWSSWTLLGQCLDSSEALTDALTNIDLPLDHPLPQMFQIKIMNELHTATNVELQLCERLLTPKFFPHSLWLMGQRGRALYDTLDYAGAQDQFEDMFKLDPNRIEDLDVYSNVLHLREKRAQLTSLAQCFVVGNKNRPEVCCIVGNHYSLRGERDKAVKYFRRATHLDRSCLTAWILMGFEYHEMANYTAAVESFRKALGEKTYLFRKISASHRYKDVNKKDSRPWVGLGAAYDGMMMPHYAIFYYQQAVKLRPNEPSIWEGLGACYEQISKFEDSMTSYQRAVECLNASFPLKRRVEVRAKITRLARNVDQIEESIEQDRKIINLCDSELFHVNLRLAAASRDNLVEQYLTSVYNLAEYHELTDQNLKLAYDYYQWLMLLGNSNAPRLKKSVLDEIKSRALLKGCFLTDADSPQCGYTLDHKEGRCLLLEYLTQLGERMAQFTRQELCTRILDGQHIVIYNGNVLRIPVSWLDAHPGGSLAILHFVGRDATSEIDAFHNDQTLQLVKKYSIGVLAQPGPWEPLLPPIASGWTRNEGKWASEANTWNDSNQVLLVAKDSEALQTSAPSIPILTPPSSKLSLQTQEQHAAAYKLLHKRITDAGLYRTPFLTGYGPEFLRYISLGCISLYAFRHNWLLTSAFALGLLWHQLMFFVHDLGHMGVSGNWNLDRLISIFIADFIGGLSVGWWVENHNVHHLVTNHPSHDPDIEYLPFFAISPKFFSSLYSSYYKRVFEFDLPSKVIISVQHKLFYLVMAFARFNLYRLSYGSMISRMFQKRRARGGRWAVSLEFVGVACFWYWFGWIVLRGCGSWQMALAYLLVSHVATSPIHVQIVLSHFGMSTDDLGPTESFPHRQLRTTMDIICPEQWEFLHGGLHLQVTHHLFPRLPRHNLRKASTMVKQFAKEEGLTYAEFGFVSANQEVMGVLREVAGLVSSLSQQVKIVAQVASSEAKEAVGKKIAKQELAFALNGKTSQVY